MLCTQFHLREEDFMGFLPWRQWHKHLHGGQPSVQIWCTAVEQSCIKNLYILYIYTYKCFTLLKLFLLLRRFFFIVSCLILILHDVTYMTVSVLMFRNHFRSVNLHFQMHAGCTSLRRRVQGSCLPDREHTFVLLYLNDAKISDKNWYTWQLISDEES